MHLDLDLLKTRLYIIKKLQRNAMRAHAGRVKGRALDIGCGSGPYRRFLACDSYVGIDDSPASGASAMASALKLPFADGAFDSCVLSEVLEHVPDPGMALGELNRVLKPGGVAYISAPMSWALHYEPRDYWRFTSHGLRHLVEAGGFKVVATERIGGVFTLAGQRMIDVLWSKLARLFSFLGARWSERIATGICVPLLLIAYPIALAGDRVDKTDALGWVVLAEKLRLAQKPG